MSTYVLPPATTTTLGGVIVKQGATVDASGNLTVSASTLSLAPVASSGSYADLTNKPTIPTVYKGSASITFGTVNDGTSVVSGTTITVTGAAVGDVVRIGVSPSLPAGVQCIGKVSAVNTVTVEVWNISGAAVNLAAATVTATIVK